MAEAHEAGWQDETAGADEQQLRQRLLRRIGLAGVLIVALVASLAMFDAVFVNTPRHESQEPATVAVNTEPVPAAETPPEENPTEASAEPAADVPASTPAEPAALPPVAETPPGAAKSEAPPVSTASRGKSEIKPITRPEPRPEPKLLPVVPEGTATPTQPLPPQPAIKPMPPVAPVAPVAPALRPTRPLAPGQGYLVQMGVFSNIANAEELKGRLDKAGIPAHIEARVQVGPFKNKAEAEAAQKKLAAMGLSGLLLSPRK